MNENSRKTPWALPVAAVATALKYRNIPKIVHVFGLAAVLAGGLALAACSGDSKKAELAASQTELAEQKAATEAAEKKAVEEKKAREDAEAQAAADRKAKEDAEAAAAAAAAEKKAEEEAAAEKSPVTLPDGHGLPAGTYEVASGETDVKGTIITCPAADGCTITVTVDSLTGKASATAMGGMITVSTPAGRLAALQTANQQSLAAARLALAGLKAMDPGDVTPNELTAAQKAIDDALKLSGNEDAPENVAMRPDPPQPDPVHTVALPDGHGLSMGMTTIPAGETVTTSSGATITCPGDADCALSVSVDAVTGTFMATSTGGMATVVAAEIPAEPTARTVVEVPSGNSLRNSLKDAEQRTLNIAPGEHVDYADVRWACPDGGSSCVVRFSDDIDPEATTGGVGSGTATAGDIPPNPNPVYGGSDLAGYLSNANILNALTHPSSKSVTALRSFDVNGDGTGDFDSKKGENDKTTAPDLPGSAKNKFPGQNLEYGTENIRLYSNIDAAKPTDFTDVYGPFVTSSRADFWGKIAEAEDKDLRAGDYTAASEAIEDATFDGAKGELTCTLTPCTLSVVDAISGTGSWKFEPVTATTKVDVSDDDYVSFGWWTKELGGEPAGLEADALWAGSDPYKAEHIGQLTGSATYNGAAAGLYEDRNFTDSSRLIERGDFTGEATLTANFGTDIISGTIIDIKIGDNQRATLPGTVTLQTAPISGNTFSGGVDWKTAADKSYTAIVPNGSWNGQFFGNGSPPTATPNAYPAPANVAGEFTVWSGKTSGIGDYTNLHGAFGAEKQP